MELPEPREIDLDGPVNYREWEGPDETTFVMVHGLGGSIENWVRVAPGLAGLGRVLALDLAGFGRTARAGRGSGLMDQRRLVSRFISEVATGEVVLSGNSMGGAISMIQAAVEPDSIHALILTGAAFPPSGKNRPHPLVWLGLGAYATPGLGEVLARVRTRELDPEQIVRLGMRFICHDSRSIPEGVLRLHEDVVRARAADPDAGAAFVEATRSLMSLERRDDTASRILGNIAAPALVMHGRRDPLVPASWAEEALRTKPAWRGRFFPDLGHVPMLEDPGRWLAEVADWFASLER